MQTTTKIFSILMATGLLAGIGFITLAKNLSQSFKSFGSKPIVQSLVSAVLAVAALYLCAAFIPDVFTQYWVMSFVFLLFGTLHMVVSMEKFIYTLPAEKTKVGFAAFLYVLAIMLIVTVAFSVIQYFFIDRNFLFYPLLFASLFYIVPFLIHINYLIVSGIPYPVYKSWTYPVHNPLDPPEDNPNEKLLVIGFEIPKTLTSDTRTYFRAKTPESIILGELFYHFINDYNELQSETPIRFMDDNEMPLTWFMRLKPKWYQRSKVLDPGITVRENGIRENSVIICERFITDDKN